MHSYKQSTPSRPATCLTQRSVLVVHGGHQVHAAAACQPCQLGLCLPRPQLAPIQAVHRHRDRNAVGGQVRQEGQRSFRTPVGCWLLTLLACFACFTFVLLPGCVGNEVEHLGGSKNGGGPPCVSGRFSTEESNHALFASKRQIGCGFQKQWDQVVVQVPPQDGSRLYCTSFRLM